MIYSVLGILQNGIAGQNIEIQWRNISYTLFYTCVYHNNKMLQVKVIGLRYAPLDIATVVKDVLFFSMSYFSVYII